MMFCPRCNHEFDPIKTRWLCPHCTYKVSCCEGEPLPEVARSDGERRTTTALADDLSGAVSRQRFLTSDDREVGEDRGFRPTPSGA